MFTEVTETQVKEWKSKYGQDSIIALDFRTADEKEKEVDGKQVYLVKPEKTANYFDTAKRAMNSSMSGDEVSASEIVFNECYLGGLGQKKEINKNSIEYLSVVLKCNSLLTVLESNFTTV